MAGHLSTNVGCREMLIRKLTYAVSWSVGSQALYLFIFLFLMNFSIFQPVQWMQKSLTTVTSFSTWLYLIPLGTIIFAQGVICSKDYVYEPKYQKTRIMRVLSVFSLRNLFMITLHILTGGLIVWLYLSLLGGQYGFVFKQCNSHFCLVEETFFMLLNGMWIGLYYFISNYLNSEKNFIFPVIHQSKFLSIKSTLLSKLKLAATEAIWPTVYFIGIYYYKGVQMREWITNQLDLQLEKESINLLDFVNSPLLIYSWMFSTLFIFTILSMRLYFEVFLTEPWAFPIESESSHILRLKEGLALSTFPIIQHLACLDFYNLSLWDPLRRQQLFILSQPGGHPHNWNGILEEVLKLISDFSSDLNKATDAILCPEHERSLKPEHEETIEDKHLSKTLLFPVNGRQQYPGAYSPMRNMALPREETDVNIVNVTYNKFISDTRDFIKSVTIDKVSHFINNIKRRSGVQYLFGEMPESRIYFVLSKGQPVIWAIQGLSFLATASLAEDKYGVVQKDLPVIATSLVTLKQNLDKLNKVSFMNRKGMQCEPIKMQLKSSLRSAVRRSLYNICNRFGEYLTQIPLSKEVHQQMQAFVTYREG